MFFSKDILAARQGGFGIIWLAATLGSRSGLKKLSKREVASVDVTNACSFIVCPPEPLALRLSSSLMVGIARIHQQQYAFYYADVNNMTMQLKRTLTSLGDVDRDINMVAPHARHDAITLTEPDLATSAALLAPEYNAALLADMAGHQLQLPDNFYDFGWIREVHEGSESHYSTASALSKSGVTPSSVHRDDMLSFLSSASGINMAMDIAGDPSAHTLDRLSMGHKRAHRSGLDTLEEMDLLGTRTNLSTADVDVPFLDLGLDLDMDEVLASERRRRILAQVEEDHQGGVRPRKALSTFEQGGLEENLADNTSMTGERSFALDANPILHLSEDINNVDIETTTAPATSTLFTMPHWDGITLEPQMQNGQDGVEEQAIVKQQGKQVSARNKRKHQSLFDLTTELAHETMRDMPGQARIDLNMARQKAANEAMLSKTTSLVAQFITTSSITGLAPQLSGLLTSAIECVNLNSDSTETARTVKRRHLHDADTYRQEVDMDFPSHVTSVSAVTANTYSTAAAAEGARFEYDDVDVSVEAPRAVLPWSVKYAASDLDGRRSITGSSPLLGGNNSRFSTSDAGLMRLLESPGQGGVQRVSLTGPGVDSFGTPKIGSPGMNAPIYFPDAEDPSASAQLNADTVASTLEKESTNFYNYTASIMEAGGTSCLYFSELMGPAGNRRDAAAQAFYHILALATKSVFKPSQTTPCGDIRIELYH